MVDSHESETGAATGSSADRAARLEARLRANAEQARQQDQQPSSGSPESSKAGDVRLDALLRRAHVPELYLGAVWERVRHPAVQQWTLGIAGRLQDRTDPTPPNWRLLGHGLLILGPVGTGKSSAAALAVREAVRIDRTARWAYVPDLLDRLGTGPKERDLEIRRQIAVGLLVWDDFGVRDMADWEVGYLDQIVDGRYRARKPMIVTSNLTGADLSSDDRLARLVDRWRERVCSTAVVLGGESMRNEGK